MGPRSIGADKLMNIIRKGELAVRKAEDRLQHSPVANSEAPSPMAQQNQVALQMQEEIFNLHKTRSMACMIPRDMAPLAAELARQYPVS